MEVTEQLRVVADITRDFRLASLQPTLRACERLAGDEPIDVAVLGQFKSGKSSLLNAVLGETIFPVGVVPVTAVITRATAGLQQIVRVTHLDGRVEEVAAARIGEFVTEAGNPDNRRDVAVVDVFTPAMQEWPGLRLVDTPGLGSIFAHNTETTRQWMPNVVAALVTIGSERPLSDEDRRLVAEAQQTALRVYVVLTKVDLLTHDELVEVQAFLHRALNESAVPAISVLPFSCRVERERWVHQICEFVLRPAAANVVSERREALALKVTGLVRACHSYLSIGLQSAERADADRDRLRSVIFDEGVKAALIRDELFLAAQRVCAKTRPTFERAFISQQEDVTQRVSDALTAELRIWIGNLAQQAQRYQEWMSSTLMGELTPLSSEAFPHAVELLEEGETRIRRIVEAFRDRLNRNVETATGISVPPVAWEAKRPEMSVIPVALGQTFMTNWELLWWMLPMALVGGLFRRHVLHKVPREVEKNLFRLAGDWANAVDLAVNDLKAQAVAWVESELATLDRLLEQQPTATTAFHDAICTLRNACPGLAVTE